jgi:hypothetical protein
MLFRKSVSLRMLECCLHFGTASFAAMHRVRVHYSNFSGRLEHR